MKYTRKKGGKYVAEGVSGCTFINPPLKCKNEPTRRNNTYISKVYGFETSALREYYENLLWKQHDPEQKFSIHTERYCELNSNNIKNSNEFNKCGITFANNASKHLTLSKYGGSDLLDLTPISKNYAPFFKALGVLLENLEFIHSKDIIHGDIKLENIVAEVQERKIVLRFIDFGHSLSTKVIETIPEEFLAGSAYESWPFELSCIDKDGNLLDFNTVKEKFKDVCDKQDDISTKSIILQSILAPNINIKEVYDSYKEYNFKNFKKLLVNLDIYSMGITIIKLIYIYFKVGILEGTKEIFSVNYINNNNPVLHTEFIENLTHTYQRNWNIDVNNKIIIPLLILALDMTSLYPALRPSMPNVIERYKSILKHIDYLEIAKVRKGLHGFNILNHDSDLVRSPITPPENSVVINMTPRPTITSPRNNGIGVGKLYINPINKKK